ncbi:MAG: hypothetical protein EOP34_06560 [Rickettsiales bacterium]|nr:MAG: hypothetical protein EOP34_06560 [Rickettsiales bacterium]
MILLLFSFLLFFVLAYPNILTPPSIHSSSLILSNSNYSTPLTHMSSDLPTPPVSPALSYASSYNSNASIETTFTTADPFFKMIYQHDLAWKNDYITSQNWHSWRILDDVLRQFKDAGHEVPNIANNNYHLLRNHAIAEYYSREGATSELTINTFIPFVHHAENANLIHPNNIPNSELNTPTPIIPFNLYDSSPLSMSEPNTPNFSYIPSPTSVGINPPDNGSPTSYSSLEYVDHYSPPHDSPIFSEYVDDYNSTIYTPTELEYPEWLDPRLYDQ